jgi:hypothetical protein
MSFGLSEMLLKQCNISYLRFWEREIMANFALKKQKWAMGKCSFFPLSGSGKEWRMEKITTSQTDEELSP